MNGRVIKCNLSQKSIGNAIKELEAYQNSLRDKNELFLKRLCELGIPVIDENIMLAQGDSDKNHNTYIKINRFGNYAQATLVCEDFIHRIRCRYFVQHSGRNKPASKRRRIWLHNRFLRTRQRKKRIVGICGRFWRVGTFLRYGGYNARLQSKRRNYAEYP